MKMSFLLILVFVTQVMCFGQNQPNNLDIGLFNNGLNGSNAGSGANIVVSLRPVTSTYTSTPVSEGFTIYLIAPKAAGFSTSDGLTITEVNSAIYGSGTMLLQSRFDIGDPYIYFPLVLNAPAGMSLDALTSVGTWRYAFSFTFSPAKTPAQFNQVRVIDQLNNAALTAANGGTPLFSTLRIGGNNQLTAGAFSTLPVSLLNFSGYKNRGKNTLNWTTSLEQNNRGFEVQRSGDGLSYTSIGFVNSQAPGGNSISDLHYTFDDNSPAGTKQYYRLNQVDLDGKSKLSNIVIITRDRPHTLSIGGLFPNPAREKINIIIDAPQRDKVTLVITDALGKTVKQQIESVDVGSNTIPVDVVKFANGNYTIKVICQSSDCETAVGRFNKL